MEARGGEPQPPPPPPPDPPPKRPWPCCDRQKEWVTGLMARIDRVKNVESLPEFASSYYVAQPPAPKYSRLTLPRPDAFYLKRCGFWAPHYLRHRCMPCCPGCGSHLSVTPQQWADKPRRVYDLHEHWYLMVYRYFCSRCRRSFRATDPESLKKMPLVIQVGGLTFFRPSLLPLPSGPFPPAILILLTLLPLPPPAGRSNSGSLSPISPA